MLKAVSGIIYYWLPAIIYAILIFLVSSLPGKDIPGLFPGQDIVFHFAEYAVFSVLISRLVKKYYYPDKLRRFICVFAVSLAYALTDEFHQFFIPGRDASFFDLAIDTAGIFAGSILL